MDGNAAVRRERGGRQSSAAGRSENLGSMVPATGRDGVRRQDGVGAACGGRAG